jgi:hypothetical protein
MARKVPKDAAGNAPKITPRKAKNAIAVAKVVAPAVLPALASVAIRAGASVRAGYDRYRARRLGVPIGDLAVFSGRGGALQARIAGARSALDDLRDLGRTSDEAFIEDTDMVLWQLAAAVRVVERLPARRRRAAHRAIAGELALLEQRLLHRLGTPEI